MILYRKFMGSFCDSRFSCSDSYLWSRSFHTIESNSDLYASIRLPPFEGDKENNHFKMSLERESLNQRRGIRTRILAWMRSHENQAMGNPIPMNVACSLATDALEYMRNNPDSSNIFIERCGFSLDISIT